MDSVSLTVEAFAIAGTVLPKSVEALFAPEAERVKVSKTTVIIINFNDAPFGSSTHTRGARCPVPRHRKTRFW